MTDFEHVGGAPESRRAIHNTAHFGNGCLVWDFARVLAWAHIGDDVSIGGGSEIGRSCYVGDGCRISANVFLPSHAQVGAKVFIGPGVTFTDDRYPRVLEEGEEYRAEPPIIEDGANIGAGAVILPGIRIGKGALVAAGAVVTHDVEPNTLVVGAPSRDVSKMAGGRPVAKPT